MKRKSQFILTICIIVGFISCSKSGSNNNNGQNPVPGNPSTGNPVETNPPNANYPSAFTGQTRIKGVTTTTAYQVNAITTALASPWGITSLPDGRLLVTQKGGS